MSPENKKKKFPGLGARRENSGKLPELKRQS
jgi:hypothetical protein